MVDLNRPSPARHVPIPCSGQDAMQRALALPAQHRAMVVAIGEQRDTSRLIGRWLAATE